jgi:atypical dual specificity phosphatase
MDHFPTSSQPQTPRATGAVRGQSSIPDGLAFADAGVERGGRCLLRGLSFAVAAPGLLFLMGPGGEGKSSLLAALAGHAPGELALRGKVTLDRRELRSADTAWVPQHAQVHGEASPAQQLQARFGVRADEAAAILVAAGFPALAAALERPAAELPRSARRLIAVLAALTRAAALYLVDEPTADMDDAHVAAVRLRLQQLEQRAMVIVATHNRQDGIGLGGATALVAGGTLQALAPSREMFAAPASAAARTYVETGYLSVPARTPARESDGIWWLERGLLCGMSRPGMVVPAERQYQALHAGGVRHLVCLEERREYPLEPARLGGIVCHHFPVPDLAPPSFAQAVDICRIAEASIRCNEGVAMHCRGGLGRTGTALAAVLVWFGEDPEDAIARVRGARPRAIQSLAQERFLRDFASRIRDWH